MGYIRLILFLLFANLGCGLNNHNISGLSGSKAPDINVERSTFYIQNGRLFDKRGNLFIARGVNNTHNYYPEEAFDSLPHIKNLGFNIVRIVWCADTVVRKGRCDLKDIHPLSALERILRRLKELKLIGILNLQNATGSSNLNDLSQLVDWYVRPEVVDLLNDYQDILLLNIANEWFPETDDPENAYRNHYLQQIPRLRDAGLPHVLIIDARGWAQQFSSIPENYPAFQAIDQNILMSVHMFEQFSNPDKVKNDLKSARRLRIPLIIGEFNCVHYPGQPIACDTIMEESNDPSNPIGYLAWSFSGNSNPLEPLDIVQYSDWKTLSKVGHKIVNHPFGVKATAKPAELFRSADQQQHSVTD
jgi:mannan endo-1,4-beta-mannosidase